MVQSQNPTLCSSPMSQEAKSELVSLKSQLESNLRDRETALLNFNNRISDLIKNHREFCQNLQRRQLELIAQAFGSTPSAHEILGDPVQYEMSDGSQFMLQTEDLVIGFMPKDGSVTSAEAMGDSKESTARDGQYPDPLSTDNGSHEPQDTSSMIELESREKKRSIDQRRRRNPKTYSARKKGRFTDVNTSVSTRQHSMGP
ncbi:hypothetical protein LZ32DRAFT_606076 [Colletotrichum eremochloae]|nr:hypothetical protein LZ32DRAFT_606076 [Colletotrichum eremochloae]